MDTRQIISKLGDKYTSYRQRSGRGGVFLSEIEGFKNAFSANAIIVIAINQYFHWLAPFWFLFVIWLAQKFLEYGMGWLDQVFLHWWQKENNFKYLTDPFMQDLMETTKKTEERLKRIEDKLN